MLNGRCGTIYQGSCTISHKNLFLQCIYFVSSSVLLTGLVQITPPPPQSVHVLCDSAYSPALNTFHAIWGWGRGENKQINAQLVLQGCLPPILKSIADNCLLAFKASSQSLIGLVTFSRTQTFLSRSMFKSLSQQETLEDYCGIWVPPEEHFSNNSNYVTH